MNEHNIMLHNKTKQQLERVNATLNKLKMDFDNYWLNLEVGKQIDNLLTFVLTFHNRQKQFLEAITHQLQLHQ